MSWLDAAGAPAGRGDGRVEVGIHLGADAAVDGELHRPGTTLKFARRLHRPPSRRRIAARDRLDRVPVRRSPTSAARSRSADATSSMCVKAFTPVWLRPTCALVPFTVTRSEIAPRQPFHAIAPVGSGLSIPIPSAPSSPARERAADPLAARLLVRHEQEPEAAVERGAGVADGASREEHRREAALHVRAAAADSIRPGRRARTGRRAGPARRRSAREPQRRALSDEARARRPRRAVRRLELDHLGLEPASSTRSTRALTHSRYAAAGGFSVAISTRRVVAATRSERPAAMRSRTSAAVAGVMAG